MDPIERAVIRILLVEDHPADAEYIVERLGEVREPRFEIRCAQRLAEAVQSLREAGDPDVIILDLSLPDSAGHATVVEMRKAAPDVPIVILTGTDDERLWRAALESGAQDYLVKTRISPDALVRSVKYALIRKRLHDELRRRQERLEEIDRLKNDFIHMAHHELMTPIVNITESLARLDQNAIAANQKDYLDIARRSAERLFRLTGDLRELTAIESDSFSVRPTPTPLSHLIRTVCRTVEDSARQAGVRILFDEGPDRTAPVDSQRIEQVLLNLLRNAIRYARAEVRVDLSEAKDSIQIRVEDDGPGIDPRDLPRIFDKFFRGQRAGKTKSGSGLGLAVAKRIIEAHGGSISAQNRDQSSLTSSGAVFTVTLPI